MYFNDEKFEMFSCLSQFVSGNNIDIKPIKYIKTKNIQGG